MPERATYISLLIFFLLSALQTAPALAQDSSTTGFYGVQGENRTIHMPPLTKIGKGIYRLGSIQINKRTSTVTFPAEVNMDKGLVEYLLVQSSGKTHESVLRTEVDPYFLNIALLLCGLEGTPKPISMQGANEKIQGTPVTIELVYHKDKSTLRHQAEEWIVKKQNHKSEIPQLSWIYTGSIVQQGEFLAQVQGSIIAVFHDPAALIDNTDKEGCNDEIWFANQDNVPPPGTDVVVRISAIK